MFTQEQKEKYSDIRISKGASEADAYAAPLISAMNLPTPSERGGAWDEIRKHFFVVQKKQRSVEKKAIAKAKREAAKNKASIFKTCKSLINHPSFNHGSYEMGFLQDIKTKRKLTYKQENYLRKLAASVNIDIEGEFCRKASKTQNMATNRHVHDSCVGQTLECDGCAAFTMIISDDGNNILCANCAG